MRPIGASSAPQGRPSGAGAGRDSGPLVGDASQRPTRIDASIELRSSLEPTGRAAELWREGGALWRLGRCLDQSEWDQAKNWT